MWKGNARASCRPVIHVVITHVQLSAWQPLRDEVTGDDAAAAVLGGHDVTGLPVVEHGLGADVAVVGVRYGTEYFPVEVVLQ